MRNKKWMEKYRKSFTPWWRRAANKNLKYYLRLSWDKKIRNNKIEQITITQNNESMEKTCKNGVVSNCFENWNPIREFGCWIHSNVCSIRVTVAAHREGVGNERVKRYTASRYVGYHKPTTRKHYLLFKFKPSTRDERAKKNFTTSSVARLKSG